MGMLQRPVFLLFFSPPFYTMFEVIFRYQRVDINCLMTVIMENRESNNRVALWTRTAKRP